MPQLRSVYLPLTQETERNKQTPVPIKPQNTPKAKPLAMLPLAHSSYVPWPTSGVNGKSDLLILFHGLSPSKYRIILEGTPRSPPRSSSREVRIRLPFSWSSSLVGKNPPPKKRNGREGHQLPGDRATLPQTPSCFHLRRQLGVSSS